MNSHYLIVLKDCISWLFTVSPRKCFGAKVSQCVNRHRHRCDSFSKHRPSGPMLSISRNVRLSVCLSVQFLRYRLTFFLPPLPEVGCPIFLEIWTPWGKVMERSGLTFEIFSLEVV